MGVRSMTMSRPRYALETEEPLEPDPVIEFYKQHVDRSLLRENLRKTPEERVLALVAAATDRGGSALGG